MITPPESERQNLLEKAHLNSHFGADAIVNALHSDGIHWANLNQEALDLVSKCVSCQRFNIGKHGYHPLRSIAANGPGEHRAIDLGEFNTTTPSGNN